MDHDNRQMLERILELTEQNNRMLRRMRRDMVWGRFVRIAYWLAIIGLGIAAYYYLPTYIDSVISQFYSQLPSFLPK